MASGTATAIGVMVALLVMVILATTGNPGKITVPANALIGVGYGAMLMASLTGPGLNFVRAIGVVSVVAVAYLVASASRRLGTSMSGYIRSFLGVIMAAALLGLMAHMLSLVGWVYIPVAIIALSASGVAVAVFGKDGGTRRIGKLAFWTSLALSWLIAIIAFALYADILFNPAIRVADISAWTYAAMAVVVVAFSSADPLLRSRIDLVNRRFQISGVVLAILLTLGIQLAALLVFGGSLLVPGVPFFMMFTYAPVAGTILLVLATFMLIPIFVDYVMIASREFRCAGNESRGELSDASDVDEPPGTVLAVAVAAAALALLVTAPTVLFVLAGVLASGAAGAAIPRPSSGRHAAASLAGALVGLGTASLWGIDGTLSFSWLTIVAVLVAFAAGSLFGGAYAMVAQLMKSSGPPESSAKHCSMQT